MRNEMQANAKSKNIRVSPYKLRPIADVIRGKSLAESQAYLKTHETKRVRPIIKVLDSAYANAQNKSEQKIAPEELFVKRILVDQGPVLKYYKPAAMGRAAVQRKRLSQITVVLESIKR
jgi:large subunit ribosomal protein L22